MSDKRTFRIAHEEARRRAKEAVENAPTGHIVIVQEPTRSLEQSALFHALCGELAASPLQWAGKRRTAEEWKLLTISGHAVATKEGSEMAPGLEGEWLNLRESSARMTKSRISSLIEYTQAFIANHKEVA